MSNLVAVILTTSNASPERTECARELRSYLEAYQVPTRLHVDSGAPPHHWRGYAGAWQTAHSLASDLSVRHALVLEDDAELCTHFGYALRLMVNAKPDALLHLHGRRAYMRTALGLGKPWARATDWLNTQAIIMPVAWVPDMLAYGNAIPDTDKRFGTYGDTRLRAFCAAAKKPCLLSVPALVQHHPFKSNLHGGRFETQYFADTLKIDVRGINWHD